MENFILTLKLVMIKKNILNTDTHIVMLYMMIELNINTIVMELNMNIYTIVMVP